MRGPGANGEAEVAVSEAVAVESGDAEASSSGEGGPSSSRGGGVGTPKRGLLRKTMSAASALGGAAAFGLVRAYNTRFPGCDVHNTLLVKHGTSAT